MDEALLARYPELELHHFWWTTRRRLVSDLIGPPSYLDRPLDILDVGCGSGVTARELAEAGAQVVGVDIEELMDEAGERAGFRMVVADYLKVFAQLGQFDVVMALDAVEHFADEGAVLKALSTNLRPGGKLVVTVPAYQWLWSSHDVENHHHRRYTRRRLRTAIQSGGLQVERVGYIFLGLLIPKAVVKLVESLTGRGLSIGRAPPGWLNKMAQGYFRLETTAAGGVRHFLPAGTTVLCVASKPVGSEKKRVPE